MKQKQHDSGSPKAGTPETSGDGVLKSLAEKAKALAPALSESADGDSRRRGEIEVSGNGARYLLRIDGVVWAEIDWNGQEWCVQDHCGYCLDHVAHLHTTVPNDGPVSVPTEMKHLNPQKALEVAKQMIRDGSMPSPESAKAKFKKENGRNFTGWD